MVIIYGNAKKNATNALIFFWLVIIDIRNYTKNALIYF